MNPITRHEVKPNLNESRISQDLTRDFNILFADSSSEECEVL